MIAVGILKYCQPSEVFFLRQHQDVRALALKVRDRLDRCLSGNVKRELERATEDAPVVKLVNLILTDAIKKKASDIHIEPYERMFRVRYRIDGVLYEVMKPPMKLKNAITSRIKIMAELDIAERRIPQDGRFQVSVNGHEVDFRVSVMPSIFGEDAVLRILDKQTLSDQIKGLRKQLAGEMGFIMPAVLLSGFPSPVENMPVWMQYIDWFNPLRHFIVIVKGVFLKDVSVGVLLQMLWPLLVIAGNPLLSAAGTNSKAGGGGQTRGLAFAVAEGGLCGSRPLA